MFRYVACVWNDADTNARQTAHVLRDRLLSSSQWWLAVQVPGVLVCHTGVPDGSNELYMLRNGTAGVVLGRLFRRSLDGATTSLAVDLSGPESDRIVTTAGRHLIERYWGRYVAFVHDSQSSTTSVLRDPSSGLPCLTMQLHGTNVYWSSMEDTIQLGLGPFHINWPYIMAALCYMRLQVHQTGLHEVSRVLGGECVRTHRGGSQRKFYWNPLQIAAADPIDDFTLAANELRTWTRYSVQSWASCYSRLLLTLSGGLDSSIVLACLHEMRPRPKVTCLNYHSPGSNTDERVFARIAARGSEVELIERLRNSTLSLDEPFLQVPLTCAPTSYLYWVENGRAEASLAGEYRAGAVFSGFGGDQGYLATGARWAPADYLEAEGVRPALFEVAMDAARMERLSVWSVLRDALAYALLGRRHDFFSDIAALNRLVAPEVVRSVRASSAFIHPWLEGVGSAPIGKVWHALQLLAPWEGNPYRQAGDPEYIAPLYSQPLIEVCMRTPTFLLTRGGRDRALARHAFQGCVPREIIRRQTKGGGEEHLKSILKYNRRFVREFLLEGELVRKGVLDRRTLDRMLKPGGTGIGTAPVVLFDCLDAEGWIQRWQAISGRPM